MGLAITIARRSLLQRPGRTLFSVAGIAVGIATVVGIFTLDHNSVLARSTAPDAAWQAEIAISPSARAGDPRQELEETAGVRDVVAAFQHEARLFPVRGQEPARVRPTAVHLVALDAEHAPALAAYELVRGRHLVADGSAREVLVGTELAEQLELELGDRVLIARPTRAPRRRCVEGEWEVLGREPESPPARGVFEVVGVLDRQKLGHRSKGRVVIVDYQYGRPLYEGANIHTVYWANREAQVDAERTEASLAQAYSYELKRSVIVGQAADERAFRNGVRFAGLLAMVLGLYVIFHTLSVSLIERVREVGTLTALGATRAQVARIFLTEALVLAGLGGALGLAGGLLMARVLLIVGVTTFGTGHPTKVFDVPWGEVGTLAAVGVLIALMGSVYPLLRARGTSTVAALRGEALARDRGLRRGFQVFTAVLLAFVLPATYFLIVPVIGETQAELSRVILLGLGVLALFICLPLLVPVLVSGICLVLTRPFELLWPLAGRMATRSVQRGSTRVAGAVAGIALVTASFVGLRGMTASLEAEVTTWGREAFLDKVIVREYSSEFEEPSGFTMSFEEVSAQLHRYPGVLGVEAADVRNYVPHLLVGVDPDELARYGPCLDDPRLVDRMKEGGVILSSRLARQREKGVGDEIHLRTGAGATESHPVIAISDAYGYFPYPDERLYAVMDGQFMRRYFCIDTEQVVNLAVRMEPGADHGVVRTALGELYPDERFTIQGGDYFFDWAVSDIARDFVLFDVILALTVALAGLGVLNGQLLAALERAREMGLLKALGTTRRQVAGAVLLESAVIGLLGGGLGVLVGASLVPVIVEALSVISDLPLPRPGAGPWLWQGLVGAVVIVLLAALYPVWRTNRLDAVAAVRAPG